jgi:ABC-type sulfate transport system permease subunit
VTSSRPLTLKEISLFFFPLLLNVQMMSVSHSIINAGLARQSDFVVALAAFSVAMVLHLFVASPSYQNHTVTIAMVRGRRSLRGTILFVLLVDLGFDHAWPGRLRS